MLRPVLQRWALGGRACRDNFPKGSLEAVTQVSKRHDEHSLAISRV